MVDRHHARGMLRRRSVLGDPDERSGPMMTPMVDVVLVILIFFMGSATIAGQEWFLRAGVGSDAAERADDAQSADGAALAIPSAVIEVRLVETVEGVRVIGLGAGALPIDAARARIGTIDLRAADGLSCVLDADPGVRVRDLVAVHDALTARGLRVSYR